MTDSSQQQPRNDDRPFPVVPRRDRIFVFREFILDTFDLPTLREGCLLNVEESMPPTTKEDDSEFFTHPLILDIAGGKGELSFVLTNADKLRSVVVDPRCPDYDKIVRTCQWYHDHPDQAAARATHGQQALARSALPPPYRAPPHVRMFFEARLLSVLHPHSSKEDWNVYWEQTRERVEQLERNFKPHRQKKKPPPTSDHHDSLLETSVVSSAKDAWDIFQSVTLVISFHSDEATDACIDFALQRQLPFCVCPCCVFPSLFPNRRTRDGRSVGNTYEYYITWLLEKHPRMRVAQLPFASRAEGHGAGLARNKVLYMLASDYDSDKEEESST